MNQVRIVTDSTADLPAELAAEFDIAVVPCQVYFGQQSYRDGVDLTPDEFFEKLAQSVELPKTSQPLTNDFVETYQRLLDETPEASIVAIHVAGTLSGTVNGAWSAAQVLPEPSRVTVIDSGQLSMGLGLIVAEAARLAQSGATQPEVVDAVQQVRSRIRVVAMVDKLDNLYKGGRITQITATLGGMLQIKPLLTVERGRVDVLAKVRTRSKAVQQLASMVRNWGPLSKVVVLHTDAKELAHTLASMLSGEDMLIEPAGPALTTHLGLGAIGVCALVAPDG
jgi:DegV family protein with EDD domain